MTTPLYKVLETMEKSDLRVFKIYHNGNCIATQDDKRMDVANAQGILRDFIEAQEGNGMVTINFPPDGKNGAETARGGAIRSLFKFDVQVGVASSVRNKATDLTGLQAITSGREKELRDQLEAANQKIKDLEWQNKLDALERKYDEKITGLEEESKSQFAWVRPLVEPHVGAIIGKFFPQAPTASTLNEDPEMRGEGWTASATKETSADDVLDNAVEDLIAVYGVETLAEVFSDLAAAAQKDKVRLQGFFPQIKLLT